MPKSAGVDDVMMLRGGQLLEPVGRGAGGEGALVQERELDARAAGRAAAVMLLGHGPQPPRALRQAAR